MSEPDKSVLVGVWKLLSHQMIVEDEPPISFYGQSPKGYLVLTPEGRMIGILTSDTRKPGSGDTERAQLHKSMIAYSGRYRIEQDQFITTVDVSWNEAWNGTEQRRNYELKDGRLSVTAAYQSSAVFPGKASFSRLVFVREEQP